MKCAPHSSSDMPSRSYDIACSFTISPLCHFAVYSCFISLSQSGGTERSKMSTVIAPWIRVWHQLATMDRYGESGNDGRFENRTDSPMPGNRCNHQMIWYRFMPSRIAGYYPISTLLSCLYMSSIMGLCRLFWQILLVSSCICFWNHPGRGGADETLQGQLSCDIGTALRSFAGTSSTIPMASSIWPVETDPIQIIQV